MRRALRDCAALAAIACCALLAAPASALAHAQLLGTSPASGETVPAQPAEVIFKFNQSVGGTLGAVRVYDAQGNEVDDLAVSHPQGNEHWMGVGLKPHLPDGTYTATYRVVSADTHIVYGGVVFSIGHPGAAPRVTVAGLIGRNRTGHVTSIAFGVTRALDYAAIALMLGGLAFLLWAWLPGMTAVASAEADWEAATGAFTRRLQRVLGLAIFLGLLSSILGILLQGASAAGVSLWTSLKGAVLENTLESRFGKVWGARAVDWLVLALLLAAGRTRRPVARLEPPALPGGPAITPRPPRALAAIIGLGVAYLALTPALSGHASIQSPTGVFLPTDVVHVLAASVWVGGIVCLLFVLPSATRRLVPESRTLLLTAVLSRFSRVALAAVCALAVTGVVQAYIDVRSFHALLNTTYGALVLVKTALLLLLIGLGWVNRSRVIPGLTRLAAAGASPGAVGVLGRRSMRGEAVLMACVFGVTAALVSYAPPIDAASGPYSANATLGPAELELTVEPARAGPNTIHLYLIDAKTGAQFTQTKELVVGARLPAKQIGPLPLHANVAGPGHYILAAAELTPAGTWQLEFTDRVSEFQEYSTTVNVPIH